MLEPQPSEQSPNSHVAPLAQRSLAATSARSISPLSAASFSADAIRDQFLERRYPVTEPIDFAALSNSGALSFLCKSQQSDRFYQVAPGAEVPEGLYRIRDEGAPEPLVTIKKSRQDGAGLAITIDIVRPEATFLESIERGGKLIAVVEKTRLSYKSRDQANCLMHIDEVAGLGSFYDLKGDTTEALEAFERALGFSGKQSINRSYYEMKRDRGVSETQLSVWQFHRKFEDYVLGVVSGTLTPLGFLTATIASSDSRTAMIVALLSAGLCDGLSDSVAASQTTQSSSKASFSDQVKLFGKTMFGKVAVPATFLPIVVAADSSTTIAAVAAGWSAVLLGATAAVQAIAHERHVPRALATALAWGAGAIAVGATLGHFVPPLLRGMLGFQ